MILREPTQTLDPRMRAYWMTQGLIVAFLAAVGVVVATVILASEGVGAAAWIVGGIGLPVVAGLGALAFFVARVVYRHFRYEVSELGLYVAKGWLWRSWQVVPHARVQTVDTSAGPLMRAFGLVAVQVTTASAHGGTEIPGLRPAAADVLVEELARRAELEEGT